MNIRTLAVLGTCAIAGFALTAHAADDPGERCLEASAKGEHKEAVVECSKALKADPLNERAREALDTAKAELARADGAEYPAKMK